jgi:hypothetical protein
LTTFNREGAFDLRRVEEESVDIGASPNAISGDGDNKVASLTSTALSLPFFDRLMSGVGVTGVDEASLSEGRDSLSLIDGTLAVEDSAIVEEVYSV